MLRVLVGYQEDGAGKEAADQFEEYCEAVEGTAAWGGQIELQALAQAIERHVLVHCVGLPVVEQGTEYKGWHFPSLLWSDIEILSHPSI